MTCICDHAGYCPLLRTTMFPEQWQRCRTDAAFHTDECRRRGVRVNGYAGVKVGGNGCQGCEAGAAKMQAEKPKPTVQRFHTTRAVVTNRRERPAMGLRDQFAGQRVFLLGGGPSLKSVDLTRLQRPGITVAAMNNVATMIRPHIWFAVDKPRNFHETIWRDPAVMKFTLDKHIHDSRPIEAWDAESKAWRGTGLRVGDCPNVWGFDHRHDWDAALFLDDVVPSWGANQADQDPEGKAHRVSVMLPAVWMLYWLGFRTIYLLGCDFHVRAGEYAFDEKCQASNQELFGWMDRRFIELKPHAVERGLTILNCTEGSALTAFERISLDSALEACLYDWPDTIVTRGMYRP